MLRRVRHGITVCSVAGAVILAASMTGCSSCSPDGRSADEPIDQQINEDGSDEITEEDIFDTSTTIGEATQKADVNGLDVPDTITIGGETFTKPSEIQSAEGIVIVTYESENTFLSITKSNDGFADETDDSVAEDDAEAGGSQDGAEEASGNEEVKWELQSGGRQYVCYGDELGHPTYVTWEDRDNFLLYSIACYANADGSAILTDETAVALADSVV